MTHYIKPPGQRDGSGLSSDLWRDCPRDEIMHDPGVGYYFRDNFTDLPTGRYTATAATSGTFALDDAARGVALADSGAAVDNQGINVQKAVGGVGELFIPKARCRIWAEAYLKLVTISTGPQFFVGLHEIDTTIIAAGAMSGSNYIGYQSVTDDGVLLFASNKAGTGTTKSATTAADGTYLKLGFKVTDLTKIEYFINGVKQGETIATANIPIVAMTPSLVCQSAGTVRPVAHIDWWEFFAEDRA